MNSYLFHPNKALQNQFLPPDLFDVQQPENKTHEKLKKYKFKKINFSSVNKQSSPQNTEIDPNVKDQTNEMENLIFNSTTPESNVQINPFDKELIEYVQSKSINSTPTTYSQETKEILHNKINPIINPDKFNPTKSDPLSDIKISNSLIEHLRETKLINESISYIVQLFCDNISRTPNMIIVKSLSYILSRITNKTIIEKINLKLLFYKEFQNHIPWLMIDKHFPTPNIQSKIIECLIGMIFNWFSYDPILIEFISIPIILNIIKNNNLEIFGSFLEIFYETSSMIAIDTCPNKLSFIRERLNSELNKLKDNETPNIVKLRTIKEPKDYPPPYSPKDILINQILNSTTPESNVPINPFDKELIEYVQSKSINSTPTKYSQETKEILHNKINPIINLDKFNPNKSDPLSDIKISNSLIEHLRETKLINESISYIVQVFCDNISRTPNMIIVKSLSYILSRITNKTIIEKINLKLLFYKEFQNHIPWLMIDKHFPTPNIQSKIIECLIGMIFNWFSYDPILVEFISIPIILNIIENNDLEIFGSFLEIFYETSSMIAIVTCPNKLSFIQELLKTKLYEFKDNKTPNIQRIRTIKEPKDYPPPYSPKDILINQILNSTTPESNVPINPFDKELIEYVQSKSINDTPTKYSQETRKILIKSINPIINPANSNLKTDINISIQLIKYFQQSKLINESISFIVQSFYNSVSQERDMSIVHGFSYILSRITNKTIIEGINLKLLFYKEFQNHIPWIMIDKHFPTPNIKAKNIECLIGMIFNWFSYDPILVEFISIPIILNIIENNNLEIFGSFLEIFYETSSMIAFCSCPNKLSFIQELLKIKLDEFKGNETPNIIRIRKIREPKVYPFPYSLQYTEISQNLSNIGEENS